MSNERKTPGPAGGARAGRDLDEVNERLRQLVASLRTEKERRTSEPRTARAPAPAAAADGRAELEAAALENRRLAAELALAREAVLHADEERARLRDRLAELARENQRVCDDYVGAQDRSTELAQLFVALERLHGGLTRAETLAAVQDIVINLVGSEELAVLERRGETLRLVQSFGIDPEPLRALRVGEGAIGRAAASGRLYVAGREGPPAPDEEDLTAAIPLRAGAEVVGVIAVYRLLGHRPGLGEADQAVFDLLSAHAGIALHLRPPPAAGG